METQYSNNYNSKFIIALIIVTILATWHSVRKQPEINWDVLPYVGIYYSYKYDSPYQIHTETYKAVKEITTDIQYQGLTGITDHPHKKYRYGTATNPEYFVNQLPFYGVKPAYPLLIYIVSATGINPAVSSVYISGFFYILIAALLFTWICKYHTLFVGLLLSSCVISIPFITKLAQLSSPDALSVFIILLSFYLIFEKNNILPGLVLACVSGLARPDNVILCLLMSVCIGFLRNDRRMVCIVAAIIAVIIYWANSYTAGAYGWKVLFYHTFVERMLDPESETVMLPIIEYLKIYYWSALNSLDYFWFISLAIAAMILIVSNEKLRSKWLPLMYINIAFMILHWLLFPSFKDRFLAASYILTMISISALLSRCYPNKNGKIV